MIVDPARRVAALNYLKEKDNYFKVINGTTTAPMDPVLVAPSR